MIKWLISLLVVLQAGSGAAQTFNGGGGPIPDNGNSISFPVSVSGLPTVIDSSYGLVSVCFTITHTYDSDLDIWLISPDSTWIELSTGNGGSGNNFFNTCFNDTVTSLISNGSAPFAGVYRPESPMYSANNGQDPNGTWRLYILDTYPFADDGDLISWSLSFGLNPPQGINFQSSNLPIVKINTNGQTIPDDPKITARMEIIDNGPGIRNYLSDTAAYSGFIGIERRGSSSQGFPKLSYGVETRDSAGNNLNVSLLGMPAENDWILNANYTDKSLMRNVITYELSRSMGYYATRSRYCELFLNGAYRGVYIFSEKIKRDNDRLDMANLTPNDTVGDELTGGYLLKIDKTTGSSTGGWTTLFPPPNGGPLPSIQYEDPDGNQLLPVQQQYIKAYCDSFETALQGPAFTNPATGYRNFIELNSWIDYFLLTELSKNVDGYRISTFFYKEKDSDGGKLRMGPVWDYDIAWGNADYFGGDNPSGYAYQFPSNTDGNQVPFWWSRLNQDPFFRNAVRCRWNQLRSNLLSTANLHAWIDSVAFYLDEGQTRNFQQWPILGVYVWPNPSPIPPDYPGVIQELKNWISNRATWMDANLPGVCSGAGLDDMITMNNVYAYPNPAGDAVTLSLPTALPEPVQVRLMNSMGQQLMQFSAAPQQPLLQLDLSAMPRGMILVELQLGQHFYRTRFIRQ
jgi:subtilisin-like proprotein convertase family protein